MLIGKRKLIFWGLIFASSLLRNGKLDSISSFNDDNNMLNLPSFKNLIEVKSSLEGRIRFYIPMLKANVVQAEALVEQAKRIPVIKKCEVNIITGSVVLEYDRENIDAQTLEGAIIKLLGLDSALDSGRLSKIESEVKSIAKAIDNGIYDYTNGILNAKSLLGLMLVFGAIFRIRNTGYRMCPDYLTLLWWATALFS